MPVDSYLPAEPFRAWLLSVFPDVYGNTDLKEFGLREHLRADIVNGRQMRISLRVADTVLTRAGVPLEEIYPYDEYPIGAVDEVDYPDGLPGYCHDYMGGMPIKQLSWKYKVDTGTMYKMLDAHNIPRRRGHDSGNKRKSALFLNNWRAFGSWRELALEGQRLYDNGKSWQEVAWTLGYASAQSAQKAAYRARTRDSR